MSVSDVELTKPIVGLAFLQVLPRLCSIHLELGLLMHPHPSSISSMPRPPSDPDVLAPKQRRDKAITACRIHKLAYYPTTSLSPHVIAVVFTYTSPNAINVNIAPTPQLAPSHLFEIPMTDKMNAVNQNTGSIQLRIIFAFVLLHRWNRVLRSDRTSYVIMVIDLRHYILRSVRVSEK